MSTIQIRIDSKTKKSAQNVLNSVGMDMSSAIKVYLKQIILREGIPFALFTENGFTPEKERSMLQAVKEAENNRNITAMAHNWKETNAYLNKLKKRK